MQEIAPRVFPTGEPRPIFYTASVKPLNPGDFMNGEFVDAGTRIVKRDIDKKRTWLSQPAVKVPSADELVDILMVIEKGV